MGVSGTSLMVAQAGALHAVNPVDGTYLILGSVGAWTGHTSMATISTSRSGSTSGSGSGGGDGTVYILQDERLWRVDATTGRYTGLGTRVWKNTTSIAMAGGTILAMESGRFYVVDGITRAYTP